MKNFITIFKNQTSLHDLIKKDMSRPDGRAFIEPYFTALRLGGCEDFIYMIYKPIFIHVIFFTQS